MSIIVAITDGQRHRVIAGDQQVTDSEGHTETKAPKVYKLPSGLLGFCGNVKPERSLVRLLRKIEDPTLDSVKLPKGVYDAVFLSKNGNAYRVAHGEAFLCNWASVFATGTGATYAYGAVYGFCTARGWNYARLTKQQMLTVARVGVKAAIRFNNTCGGRVQVKHLELL